MGIYKIDDINKFTRFLMELVDDVFSNDLDNLPSCYYFHNGGCYELAQIIHHYFPATEYAVDNKFNHVAIYSDGTLYDSYTPYSNKELEEMNIYEDNQLDIKNFKIYTKEEIDNFEIPFGRNIKLENKDVISAIIDELNDTPSIKIGK